jgi:hypothetical protein
MPTTRTKSQSSCSPVDGAIRSHPELGTLYQQIKNGTLTGLSLAGYFKRIGTK